MCMYDGEDSVIFRETQPRAQCRHFCGECGRKISVGETYYRVEGISDRRFFTAKTCAHCKWGADWLMKHCHGYIFGGVHEDLKEHVECGAEPAAGPVGRAVVGMKRRWTRRDGELMEVPA